MIDITKNGQATARTGGRYIPSQRFILRNDWRDAVCKYPVGAKFIDRQKKSCIIQVRAEPKNPVLPIYNYQQILYQFLSLHET